MTDTLLKPDDTGDIPRPIGETRIRIAPGELTENLAEYVMTAPSFDAIPRRVIEIDDTVQFRIPETIGVVDCLDGNPQPKPTKPLPPPPKYDMAAAQPVAPWGRVADTEQLTVLGSLGADLPEVPFPPLRKSVPYVLPADRKPWSGPRHAAPAPLWARVSIAAGLAMLLGSTLGLAVLAVIQ
jgi:hypothetical protein